MMPDRLVRWVARWLDRRGLPQVADVVDAGIARKGDVEAKHAIARRALSEGKGAVAIAELESALQITPDDASLWCTLGAAHRRNGAMAEARRAYERAHALESGYPQVLSNLGEWCIASNRHEEALEWFEKALACSPRFFEARLNRVAALFESSRFEEARTAAEQLVADNPGRPEAYLNLGNILVHIGKAKQGIAQYKKALEVQPDYPEAHFNLAILVGSRSELANAIGYVERQIRERGESAYLLGFLASAHHAAGHLADAERLCRRMLDRQPDSVMALITLANCISAGGDAAPAHEIYERIVAIDGQQFGVYSNVVFELQNLFGVPRERLFRRHLDWAERFEAPLRRPDDFQERDRNPLRRLRVGYVSGDFVVHPVGFLLREIMRHHDPAQFEIHCFSMVIREQDVMPELRKEADKWEDIFFLNDEEVVDLIREAEIDILVDLTGHTAFHRLQVFARRPAPIQFEWIGYFHSTGLSSIDYFITDPHTTPPGGGQRFSETPVYLPHSRFCYSPPDYAPDVAPPPCAGKGWVTFGSFNRLAKMNDEVVAAWSRVLIGVPGSRLVVKSSAFSEDSIRERIASRFAAHGVGKDMIDLREASPHAEMLAEYSGIDIALDTFPFNGGMTTLEALWMGVPVVTVAGDSVVSRQTFSALANIGLETELAFPDVDSFIAGAVALANDRERLARLRRAIRPRMAASPVRQAEKFTRDLESLFRRAWQAYCRGERLPNDAEGKGS